MSDIISDSKQITRKPRKTSTSDEKLAKPVKEEKEAKPKTPRVTKPKPEASEAKPPRKPRVVKPKIAEAKEEEIEDIPINLTNEIKITMPEDNTKITKSTINDPEFLLCKDKWLQLCNEIDDLNKQRDVLEEKKNNFVKEMYKIIEKYQPKVNNLFESTPAPKSVDKISSRVLDNNSDNDTSDSDNEIVIKKTYTPKKSLDISSDEDSD
jgi:hypothetical protein